MDNPLERIIIEYGGIEISPMEAYTDIFKLGDGYIQQENKESRTMKANPIVYWRNADKSKGHYRILFEDTFEQWLKEAQEADFAILNGVSYFGHKNIMEHSSQMFAMIVDLDGVTSKSLENFFYGAMIEDEYIYPMPNYVALSGHGVHLYYVFDVPISLYPNIKLQLKEFKYALIEKVWNPNTSIDKKVQYQGINQGFRVLGGKTKIDGVRVRPFRMNQHPWTLNELNYYIPEEHRIDDTKLYKESKITLEQAKDKYPLWYEKVIVQGDKTKKIWDVKPDLYEWWKRKIKEGASYHHRYFSIMCLAIYASKCAGSITEDKLREDAYELMPFLNAIQPSDPFTETDIESALECYDARYVTFPIDDIVNISGIQIEKNKRNGRKRAEHVKLMNFIRDEINGNTDWRNKDGRPTKEAAIEEWRKTHPEGTKSRCARELGISRPTMNKWWKA